MEVGGYSQWFHPFSSLFFHSIPAGKQVWGHSKWWDHFGGHCITFLPCSPGGMREDYWCLPKGQKPKNLHIYTSTVGNLKMFLIETNPLWGMSYLDLNVQELGESFTCVLSANPQYREREVNPGLRSGKKIRNYRYWKPREIQLNHGKLLT